LRYPLVQVSLGGLQLAAPRNDNAQ